MYEGEFFGDAGERPPTWSAVGVPGLLRAGMAGQYRAIADIGARTGLVSATAVPPTAADGEVADRGDPEAQARSAFEALGEALGRDGASLADVVQLASFHIDHEALDAAVRVGRELLGGKQGPAWTAAGMTGTWEEGQQHSLHALALR